MEADHLPRALLVNAQPEGPPFIDLCGIGKSFTDVRALNDVTLTVA